MIMLTIICRQVKRPSMNEAVFCTDYIRKLCKNVEFCYCSVTFSAGVAFAHQPDDVIHEADQKSWIDRQLRLDI